MALDDLKAEILRYSTENGYPAESIEQLVCDCGSEEFTLFSDDTEGGAVAVCCKCEMNLSIYDSADFMVIGRGQSRRREADVHRGTNARLPIHQCSVAIEYCQPDIHGT